MPPAPPSPPAHKSVTFCTHCKDTDERKTDKFFPRFDPETHYYSDPGDAKPQSRKSRKKTLEEPRIRRPLNDSTDSELGRRRPGFYSEPDVNYFEIDYHFLKQLRMIARINCPRCEKRSSSKRTSQPEGGSRSRRSGPPTRVRRKENKYQKITCDGRSHRPDEHCKICCRVCNSDADCEESNYLDCASVSRSYSLPAARVKSTKYGENGWRDDRKTESRVSIHSLKSVSFLEEGGKSSTKDTPNYMAKSFTNDLKQFLLTKPVPKMTLKDKLLVSFMKSEAVSEKKIPPKLKSIRGLWKSY